jgi:hypothetical protein
LSRDGIPSRVVGPASRRLAVGIASCGLVLAVVGGAFLAGPGQSAPSVENQRPGLRFPGGPYFALGCGFSHSNNDDPIVFAGQPGKSHNHTFVGNRSVGAETTPNTLLAGPTTCDNTADSSGYWFPTLYIGQDAVVPLTSIVYYVKRTTQDIVAHPPGLKMIAGNAYARTRQAKGIVSWSCGGGGGLPRYYKVPYCRDDGVLRLEINFPNCWNGRTLDSADHKRHMAYARNGVCPASHPTAVPTLAIIVLYPPVPASARVSSGKFALHADFINGWDQDVLSKLVAYIN